MKTLFSTIAALMVAFCVSAQSNKVHTISFNWIPLASDMGGLSTNDYMTNITFVIYSTTNINTPIGNWQVLTNIPGAAMLSQGPCGTFWTNDFTYPAGTLFLVARTQTAKGGVSPFSNIAPWFDSRASGAIELLR